MTEQTLTRKECPHGVFYLDNCRSCLEGIPVVRLRIMFREREKMGLNCEGRIYHPQAMKWHTSASQWLANANKGMVIEAIMSGSTCGIHREERISY